MIKKQPSKGRKKTIEKIEEELCVWTEIFTWITTSSQTKNIPDPIIDYLFIYKELIDVLYREGRTEFATKHEIHLKKFMIKILNNHTISAKSRVKIKYPGIYKVYMNARGIIPKIDIHLYYLKMYLELQHILQKSMIMLQKH